MKKGRDMQSFRQRGFTLIELMITVVIVASLASVALPAYQEQVRRGHRAAAQTEMMDIANRQQQFLLANRAYADKVALEGSGYALPTEVAKRYGYDIAVNNAATPPTFTITFTPSDSQSSDGVLVLNSAGAKTRAAEASKW